MHDVHVASFGISSAVGSIVALNIFPPTTWWRWAEGSWPSFTILDVCDLSAPRQRLFDWKNLRNWGLIFRLVVFLTFMYLRIKAFNYKLWTRKPERSGRINARCNGTSREGETMPIHDCKSAVTPGAALSRSRMRYKCTEEWVKVSRSMVCSMPLTLLYLPCPRFPSPDFHPIIISPHLYNQGDRVSEACEIVSSGES